MEENQQIILRFDKLMLGFYCDEYRFQTEEIKQKNIQDFIKFISKFDLEIVKEIKEFDWSSERTHIEHLFSKTCKLNPKVPIEYWNLKTSDARSKQDDVRSYKTLLSDY